MASILVLNGPNLNLLGRREPHLYGTITLDDIEQRVRTQANASRVAIDWLQTNHEGVMIDHIHSVLDQPPSGIIINPGAWTHSSVAIRDALSAIECPFVEVHLTNIHSREPFRAHSYFSDQALAVIAGCGAFGYEFAMITLLANLNQG